MENTNEQIIKIFEIIFKNHPFLFGALNLAAKSFLNFALSKNLTYCKISFGNLDYPYLVISIKKSTKEIFYGLYYHRTSQVSKSFPIKMLEDDIKFLENRYPEIYKIILYSISVGKFKLQTS